MGIIIRQSVKTVAVTYAGVTFGFLNTLVLYPLVLTEEQVGLTRTLINAAMLFSTFAAFGAATMPNRFFPYFKDPAKQHHGFLFFLLTVGAAGFTVFSLLFTLFQPAVIGTYVESAPLIVEYLHFLLPFTFVALFYNIFETYTIVHQLPVVPTFLREVLIRGMIAAGMVLILLQVLSFHSFVVWTVASYGLALAVIILYLRNRNVLFLTPRWEIVRGEHFRPMVTYGGFALLGNVSGAVITNIDGLILSAYSGLKSTGIYAIAFFIAQMVEIPKRSLSQVLVPLVSEANKNNDREKLRELYRKSSINQLIVGGIIFLCLWCNIENIFRFIPNGESYVAGKWVVFFIGLAKLFDMATGINAEIIGTSKYYKFDLLFYIFLSIVGIGTSLLLIPVYGLVGAAVASCISVVLFNTARYLFIAYLFRMQPFSRSTLTVIALGLAVIGLNSLVPDERHPLLNIAFRSAGIAVVFLGGSLLLNVSEDINGVVKKVITRMKISLGKK